MLKSITIAAALFLALQPCWAQRNLSVAPPPPKEQRLALVIGNATYSEAPLRNPVNDASDVAAALRELGFEVILKTNSRQREMKQAVREFGERLAKGGVGLFYFAGHGLQFKGRNFLVPLGAQIERESDVEDEAVDANFVLAQMEEARNRVNIVILDACRNNPYARGVRSASRGLAQMDATSGTLIAFATAPGSVAADGADRNGVYTKHLLRQMREAGVPVELMLKRVRDGVMSETQDRQVPWESSSLRGADFYFKPAATQPGGMAMLSAQTGTGKSFLKLAMNQVGRGNQLLLQGREKEADVEYAPAFDVLKQFKLEELDDEAKVALGRLYSRIGRDHYTGLAMLRPLAEKGDATAQNGLAFLYRDGRGTAKDDRQALLWFRKSAAQGNAFAQNQLGRIYAEGVGVPRDDREAAKWFRRSADQGYPHAQNWMGVLYRDGRGMAKDDREAVTWFRKAADQQNSAGQSNLGFMYERGLGVAQNNEEAVRLYRLSADQGHHWGQNNLGAMYERGRGVAKDARQAAAWYQKAAAQGNEKAKESLARVKGR